MDTNGKYSQKNILLKSTFSNQASKLTFMMGEIIGREDFLLIYELNIKQEICKEVFILKFQD